ncbi:hypothetical protein V1477_004872, partial [Vespula maculifrons]
THLTTRQFTDLCRHEIMKVRMKSVDRTIDTNGLIELSSIERSNSVIIKSRAPRSPKAPHSVLISICSFSLE